MWNDDEMKTVVRATAGPNLSERDRYILDNIKPFMDRLGLPIPQIITDVCKKERVSFKVEGDETVLNMPPANAFYWSMFLYYFLGELFGSEGTINLVTKPMTRAAQILSSEQANALWTIAQDRFAKLLEETTDDDPIAPILLRINETYKKMLN